MLPEVGATELLVIAVVALIVVGPKDLPVLLRKLGQFMGRLRAMAADFRSSFDEMARQSELDDLRKEVEAMRRGQFLDQAGLEASEAEVNRVFNEIDDGMRSGAFQMHPPMGNPYAEAASLPPLEPEAPPPAKRTRKAPAKAAGPKAPAAKTAAAKTAPAKRAAKPRAKTGAAEA
jgi:sec-independent protein translocase protein TatB